MVWEARGVRTKPIARSHAAATGEMWRREFLLSKQISDVPALSSLIACTPAVGTRERRLSRLRQWSRSVYSPYRGGTIVISSQPITLTPSYVSPVR
jgi:hypothetical protein